MQKKLIAIDLDGTTLNTRTTIHPLNVQVLKKAQMLGHKVVIATGRPWRATRSFYDELALNTPVCNYNGSYIHNPKDTTFHTKKISIPREMVLDLEKTLHDNLFNIMCELEDIVYLVKQDPRLDGFFWRDSINVTVGEMKDILDENPTTIIIQTNTIEDNDIVLDYVNKNYPDYCCRFWGKNYETYAEIFPKHINKGEAILYIAQELNIDQQDIIAFGDASNDIELLTVAAKGVAMINGVEELRNIADEITAHSCIEGGLALHLSQLLSIEIEQ
jgi:hypothetical protein